MRRGKRVALAVVAAVALTACPFPGGDEDPGAGQIEGCDLNPDACADYFDDPYEDAPPEPEPPSYP